MTEGQSDKIVNDSIFIILGLTLTPNQIKRKDKIVKNEVYKTSRE